MVMLYYSPGACSLAAHIVLEESGDKYELKRVDFSQAEQRSQTYLEINPLGRVPALILDSGEPIAENTAILPYLGKRYGLWPSDPVAEARALAVIGFFASSVHPSFAHFRRPERYAKDEAAFATLKEVGLNTYQGFLRQIDQMLTGGDWFLDRYSVLDPYALVFYFWAVRAELPIVKELDNYTAFKDRMLARPAVRRAVEQEQLKIS